MRARVASWFNRKSVDGSIMSIAFKLSMLYMLWPLSQLLSHGQGQGPAEVSRWIFALACIGLLAMTTAGFLTMLASEVRSLHTVEWDRVKFSIELNMLSLCIWTLGLTLVMLLSVFCPELLTAVRIKS